MSTSNHEQRTFRSAARWCILVALLAMSLIPQPAAAGSPPEKPTGYLWIWLPNLEGRWKEYVDFAADWKCTGVVLWGLDGWREEPANPKLRGSRAFCRELVQYAHARGVKVVQGFGLNGYDEGNHVCQRVPEAAAQIPDRLKDTELGKGSVGHVFCPSNPKALVVLREKLLAAADTGLDGFNFETADVDYITCHCPKCEARFQSANEQEHLNKPPRWCIEQANWAIDMLQRERPKLWLSVEFAVQKFGRAPYRDCPAIYQMNREIDPRATVVWAEFTYPPQELCQRLAAGRKNVGFYIRGGEGGWGAASHIKTADIVSTCRRLWPLAPACLMYRAWTPLDRWAVNMAVAAEAMRDSKQPDAHFADVASKAAAMTAPGQKYSVIAKVVPGNLAAPVMPRTVSASSEDRKHGLLQLTDGVAESGVGMWLTEKDRPAKAWAEIRWPSQQRIGRVRIFHQIDGHYRSLDYSIEYWDGMQWRPVEGMPVKGNTVQGWREHVFSPVTTQRLRLLITRSAYGDRMGVGELEVYEK